jgi:hypothetical protein
MWLAGDSEILQVDTMNKSSGTKMWFYDTVKTAVATSAAVMMAAGIGRIQDYVVNIGLPQQSRLGTPGMPTTQSPVVTRQTSPTARSYREQLLAPY